MTTSSDTDQARRLQAELLAGQVWRLCDVLRDDGITYHQYINELSYLLFLKMAAETGVEEQLPAHCRWGRLLKVAGKEQLTVYLKLLAELGGSDDPTIAKIFQNPTSLLRNHDSLGQLVRGIDAVDWHDTSIEGFGDIYESLLKYSSEKRSGAGQYFTPRPLIDAIVAVERPSPGENIQDPALGTAGFLVSASLHHKRHHQGEENCFFVGVELVPENYRLALMNTYLHGMEGLYERGDTLSTLGSRLPKANLILTNPPFGAKRGGSPSDARSDLPHPTANKQLAFLQHIMGALTGDGRAAVIVPDNVLFEPGVGDSVRKSLFSDFNLHTILRLPRGIFYAAGVDTNVLFFDRAGPTRKMWVYDARTNVPAFNKSSRVLTRAFFDEFVKCYGPAASGAGRSHSHRRPRWRRFTAADVKRLEYKLDRLTWMEPLRSRPAPGETEPEALFAQLNTQLHAASTEVEGLLHSLRRIRGN